jgi:hypothetical protein
MTNAGSILSDVASRVASAPRGRNPKAGKAPLSALTQPGSPEIMFARYDLVNVHTHAAEQSTEGLNFLSKFF